MAEADTAAYDLEAGSARKCEGGNLLVTERLAAAAAPFQGRCRLFPIGSLRKKRPPVGRNRHRTVAAERRRKSRSFAFARKIAPKNLLHALLGLPLASIKRGNVSARADRRRRHGYGTSPVRGGRGLGEPGIFEALPVQLLTALAALGRRTRAFRRRRHVS